MKVLFFDIETSPILANVWSLWSEARDFKFVDVDWYVLSWSAKWLGKKKVTTKALLDYDTYKKDRTDDKELLKEIWKLLDEADIVCAHNGIKFDVKKLNTRFITQGMNPPSPYKIIDTLKEAKACFRFSSNRLDTIAQILGVGRKVEHSGFQLWRDCLDGKRKAWRLMKKYNSMDVVILEKIYLKMLPYIKNHPNVNLDNNLDNLSCNTCGSHHIIRQGYAYTNVSKFARYKCKDCGKWGRTRINELEKYKRNNILCNIS